MSRGTKYDPIQCYDIHEAFDACREMARPIVVTLAVDEGKPHPEATLYKCYPSGMCLWSLNADNAFQHFTLPRGES